MIISFFYVILKIDIIGEFMETIIIDELDRRTYIDIDRNTRMGNTFYNDGRIEPVTSDVLSVFQAFVLSKNNKELPNEGKYKVILDNETGFKHYFLNGEESYIMFFLNNGEDGRVYKDKKKKKIINDNYPEKVETLKEKIFNIGDTIVRCTCMGLLLVMMSLFMTNTLYVASNPHAYKDFGTFPIISYLTGNIQKTYDADELITRIRSSKVLETEDQLFLANKDFLEDIMPYVNASNDARFCYSKRFNNIHIEIHPHNENYIGYYMPTVANCLYVSEDIANDNQKYNNTLAHEFVHLCQSSNRYNLLIEATAEILSYEYYEDSPLTSYPDEVYLTRKLMEIIGPEPILHYVIGNNFTYIEKAMKPLLSKSEYHEFVSDLSRPNRGELFYNEEKVKAKFASLDRLLDKAYKSKYGMDSSEDKVLPYLRDPNLVRYYFNHRKINNDYSYLSLPIFYEEHLTLEEAHNEGYVYLIQTDDDGKIIPISYQDYMDSKYDFERPLEFCFPKPGNFRLYLGDDSRLHLAETKIIDEKKLPLPTIYEKFNEVDAITK